MSTHAPAETRHASPAEPTPETDADTGPDPGSGATDGEETGPDSFDAHDGAATFGASTHRLPNTVDEENEYAG